MSINNEEEQLTGSIRMEFKRGQYRFRVASECKVAFRNALRILEEFGYGEEIVNVMLGEIKARVCLGYCPNGAKAVEGRPGFYSMTFFSVVYIFSVNDQSMLIAIEDVDASALVRILSERAAR